MSTIVPGGAVNPSPDGIPRYRTTCRVWVHSHQSESHVDISDDVVQISTSKTVKGAGQANITLLAHKNWFNLLFPNDYINIYFDINDGQGWTRTFFGFIDRIEEDYAVDPTGKPTTAYHVLCTDVVKAFDKTQVYFNPHVAGREDLVGDAFGAPNIGGLALMTKGIEAHGTPTDIVQNMVLLLLGFGTQYNLPLNYPGSTTDVSAGRDAKLAFIKGRLGKTAKTAVDIAGGFDKLLENIEQSAEDLAKVIKGKSNSDKKDLAKDLKLDVKQINSTNPKDVNAFAAATLSAVVTTVLGSGKTPADRAKADFALIAQAANSLKEGGGAKTLLDIIDMFNWIENSAIDGYHAGTSIWQAQGSLLNMLRSYSNEWVNELFFDLRPVPVQAGDGSIISDYSRDMDDVGGNAPGAGVVTGIKFIPAIVMREYPWSTIQEVDASHVTLTVDDKKSLGKLRFGAIFSDGPNKPGHHQVAVPAIDPHTLVSGKPNVVAHKHIDVAVIKETDIIRSTFGRSDNEHYNMFEFYSDSLGGMDMRFFVRDISPIASPIQISRHGLRVRTMNSNFARFSISTTTAAKPTPSEEPAVEEENVDTTPGVNTNPVTDPVAKITSGYGYRPKSGKYIFHNGIDIRAPKGTPVYCVADGTIVASGPNGGLSRYGNCIMVKHELGGEEWFTFYAHLDTRTVAVGQKSQRQPNIFSKSVKNNGKFTEIPIKGGDQIGTVGETFGRPGDDVNNTTRGEGVFVEEDIEHLHFEVSQKSGSGRFAFLYPTRSNVPAGAEFAYLGDDTPDYPSSPPSGAPTEGPRSRNPVVFLENTLGLSSIPTTAPTTSELDSEEDQEERESTFVRDEDEKEPTEGSDDIPEGLEGSRIVAHVDGSTMRTQIARWALLQDHWFQHNLEYFSGQIDMRPAPEIRVGYRLDYLDRALSCYVEGVSHTWKFPDKLTTTLQVTRGQANNPFPVYVLPKLPGFTKETESQRTAGTSRLAKYFITPDPLAVRRAVVIGRGLTVGVPSSSATAATSGNVVDLLDIKNNEETVIEATIAQEQATHESIKDLETALKSLDLPGSTDLLSGTTADSPLTREQKKA